MSDAAATGFLASSHHLALARPMASSSFASQASHASLLALSSPLSSNLSASALIRSASDLAGVSATHLDFRSRSALMLPVLLSSACPG